MLNGSQIMTKIDLNKIVSEFTRKIDDLKDDNKKLLEKINSLSESFSDEKKLRKRKHNEIKTSSEIGSNSVKLKTEPIKKESVMENTKIYILYEDMDKLKKENKNLRENIEKISKVVNNYANNFGRLSQIQNLLIGDLSNTQIIINSSPRVVSRPLDEIFFEIKNKMGCDPFFLDYKNERAKRRKIIRDIERKHLLNKKSGQSI